MKLISEITVLFCSSACKVCRIGMYITQSSIATHLLAPVHFQMRRSPSDLLSGSYINGLHI